MRNLQIITCQPDDLLYWWELKVFLTNLRKYNLSKFARVLIWRPYDRLQFPRHPKWKELEEHFLECRFFYYDDNENSLEKLIVTYNYIPLLRPIMLEKHFRDFPDLVNDTIYYTDCDTCFTQDPTFLKGDWIQDDITRMSFTGIKSGNYNYQGAKYLDEKVKDVLPEKLEAYKQIDIVQGLAEIFKLDRAFFVSQENNFGGVQYLLKNIDASYWRAVLNGCIHVKNYFGRINRMYFANEDKGIQSWCADLWSNQLNLWRLGRDTQTPDEMSFCWATDPISKWDTHYIYHDAGASASSIRAVDGGEHFLFNKRDFKYINNISTPFQDDLSFVSKDFCSYNYVKEIEAAK